MHVVSATVLDGFARMTDDEIVAEVLKGRTALFEILMRRHNERVYRAARAIVRDEDEAEDVMQQAYVNAYTHLGQFDGRARFSTWLTKIAVYEALRRAKRQGRHEQLDTDTPGSEDTSMATQGPDPERQAFASELGALLEAAIDGLPDGCREVFMLRQVEGMSTGEVAATLDVSEDVVKTRLSRGRAALRRDLFERMGGSATQAFRFEAPRCDRVVAAVLSRIL